MLDMDNNAKVAWGNQTFSDSSAVVAQLWKAPEVVLFGSTPGPANDIYSFGIVLWEIVSRKHPEDELGVTNAVGLREKLSTALRRGWRPKLPSLIDDDKLAFAALIRKCWSEDPARRPPFDETEAALLEMVPARILRSRLPSNNSQPEDESRWKFSTLGPAPGISPNDSGTIISLQTRPDCVYE